MGNLHGLLQIRPLVSHEGVALPVRAEHRDVFWQEVARPLPSYMSAERCVPSFTIPNVNVGSSRLVDPSREVAYLILQGGGKWGYGDDFWDRVGELGPLLEDAQWYFDDEYTGFVDEFRLVAGELSRRRVVDEESNNLDYVVGAFADDRDLMFELHYHQATVGAEYNWELGDATLATARKLRPDHVPTQIMTVHYLLARQRHQAALDILHDVLVATDRALAAGSDVEGTLTQRQKQVYLLLARAEAGLGRHEAALASFVTADQITPTWGNYDARFERGELLRKLGRFAEAREDLLTFLRLTPHKVRAAEAYFALARIHVQLDERDAARRRLEQVLELGPDWRTRNAAKQLLEELEAQATSPS